MCLMEQVQVALHFLYVPGHVCVGAVLVKMDEAWLDELALDKLFGDIESYLAQRDR